MTGRDEGGSALVELTWLVVLLLVPLVYVLLAVFDVQRAAFAVSAASRAAGRAYSLAPSQDAALVRARAAAAVALEDQGLHLTAADLAITCRPDPAACLTPGSVIAVRIGYAVPLPLVPDALGGGRPTIHVDAVHEVPYGMFREARP